MRGRILLVVSALMIAVLACANEKVSSTATPANSEKLTTLSSTTEFNPAETAYGFFPALRIPLWRAF